MCGPVTRSSFDEALLNKEVVQLDNMRLLDIRRCEELVPI